MSVDDRLDDGALRILRVASPDEVCGRAMRHRSSRDQQPATTDGILVMITKFTLCELLQIVRQDATTTTGSETWAGVRKAPQVGVDLTRYLNADLVFVAMSADHLGSNTVLHRRRHGDHFPLVPYGDWFVGLRLTPISEAWDATAPGVRPSLSPITRVGVFSFAKRRRAWSSDADQDFWWLGGFFAMVRTPSEHRQSNRRHHVRRGARHLGEHHDDCYGARTS